MSMSVLIRDRTTAMLLQEGPAKTSMGRTLVDVLMDIDCARTKANFSNAKVSALLKILSGQKTSCIDFNANRTLHNNYILAVTAFKVLVRLLLSLSRFLAFSLSPSLTYFSSFFISLQSDCIDTQCAELIASQIIIKIKRLQLFLYFGFFQTFLLSFFCVIMTSLDVDECSTGSHSCNSLATCHNTPGGYTCTCKDCVIVEMCDLN